MRVKIGDRWHDTADQPICIQLTPAEEDMIAERIMTGTTGPEGKMAFFPDDWGSADEMLAWMD